MKRAAMPGRTDTHRAPSARSPRPGERARRPPVQRYVFGLYRRAPNRPELDEASANAIQGEHLTHLRRLRESGELIVSGPSLDEA